MSVIHQKFSSFEDLFQKTFQDGTEWPIFILPSLEMKKDMVEVLANKYRTVPDQNILRLNEFFIRQVQRLAPEIQFLDKDLLNLTLKMNLNSSPDFKQYTPFIDVALDYISILSPILGRDIYRQALEELIESDELFLKNYGDIYPFLVQLWDLLLKTKQLLPSWSLGWLFLNFVDLENKPLTIYILGYNKLKKIEKDFFEDLSNSWSVVNVEVDPGFDLASPDNENTNYICKVVSPTDEIELCLKLLENSDETHNINIIAPKTKWFYKNIIEVFLPRDPENPEEMVGESFREQLNSFLTPLKVFKGDFHQGDIQRLWRQKSEIFNSESDFKKATFELFETKKLLELHEHLKNYRTPEGAIHFMDFLDAVVASHEATQSMENVLRKIYPLAIQIPKNLKLDISTWLNFIDLKLDQISPFLKSSKLNFYTLEETRWAQGETNIFLSCTRQDYERSLFAYLSDYEISKIKDDLGFDLEGLSPAEAFKKELEDNSFKAMTNYFLVPEFDFMGTSQQLPQFIQELETHGAHIYESNTLREAPKVINEIKNVNKCEVDNFTLTRLSASALQMFIDRPYEYFLTYVLGLKDEDPIDVDPSALLSGVAFHGILAEFLNKEDLSFEEMSLFTKDMVKENYKYWSNTLAPEMQISKYLKDIQEYLLQDRERKIRTKTKTIALEKKFEAFFDLNDLKFYKDNTEGRIRFSGAIDRIDLCEEHIYVLDYKSGKANNLPYNVFSSPQVQMPLYGMIIQDGILDIPGELAGLLYVSIKSQFQDVPVLMIKDHAEKYLERKLSPQNSASLSVECFNETILEYRHYVKAKIIELQNNNFGSWMTDRDGNKISIELDF